MDRELELIRHCPKCGPRGDMDRVTGGVHYCHRCRIQWTIEIQEPDEEEDTEE